MSPCVIVILFSYGNHTKWFNCELRKARGWAVKESWLGIFFPTQTRLIYHPNQMYRYKHCLQLCNKNNTNVNFFGLTEKAINNKPIRKSTSCYKEMSSKQRS